MYMCKGAAGGRFRFQIIYVVTHYLYVFPIQDKKFYAFLYDCLKRELY